MSKKKDDKSPDPGLGTLLGVGAAVVAGAALMYGAKKLFDFFDSSSEGAVGGARANPPMSAPLTVEDSCCQDKCHDSDSDEEYHRRRTNSNNYRPMPSAPSSSDNAARYVRDEMNYRREPRDQRFFESASEPYAGARPKTSAQPPTSPKRSLSDDLRKYYHDYVMISPAKMSAARNVVQKIVTLLSSALRTSSPQSVAGTVLTVHEVKEVGSTIDNLQVITCGASDILVVFASNERNLELESVGSGSWFVTQIGDDATEKNVEILSSSLIDLLKDTLERICDDIDIPIIVNVSRIHSTLQLDVKYFDDEAMADSKLCINLRPAIIYEGKCLVPVDSCSSTHLTPENVGKVWRQSHFEEECRLLNRYGPSIDTHRAVLKILKAIRVNFPAEFGVLTSYHYKTILMRLLDDQPEDSEWCDSALSERFIDFMLELGSCCKEKILTNFFERDVNLLEDISSDSLQNLSQYINKIVGHNDFSWLLLERNFASV